MTARHAALPGLLITALAVLYAGTGIVTGWEPGIGWVLQAGIHVGELLVVVAVAMAGAAGRGLLGRVGLGAAVVGQLLTVAAEVIYPSDHGLGDALFSVGPLLSGAGLVAVGVAVVTARRWRGWSRLTVLATGVYVFVVLIPAMIGTGGPPAPAALAAIAVWDLLWALTAVSALVESESAPVQVPVTTSRA